MRPHLFLHQGQWCVQPACSPIVYAWDTWAEARRYAALVWRVAVANMTVAALEAPAVKH